MISLKIRNGKPSVSHILKSAPAIVGCLLFIGSVILPFYRFNLASLIETRTSILYWSFKFDIQTFRRLGPFDGNPLAIREFWFCNYWFDYYTSSLGLSWIMISMFIIQILILISGVASIFIGKRIFAIVPAVLCPMNTALMIYVNVVLQESTWALSSYQLGYWLTYPSIFLFIANFLLKAKFDKSF